MRFEVSAKLKYEAKAPSTLILSVQAYRSEGQQVIDESFVSDVPLVVHDYVADRGEKRFKVLEIPDNGIINLDYRATVDNGCQKIPVALLDEVMISRMPVSVLPYLNPSRYCQSDKLYKFASNKFGHIVNAYKQVIAIRDWIFNNVEYQGGSTNANTSAHDTLTDQMGVCRDFAHLGIALCRALTIPARYFTGYAYKLKPQ